MGYEQVYKVITLYNGHRGCLNDDGTVMNDAQMAERIAALTEADIDAAEIRDAAAEGAASYMKDYEGMNPAARGNREEGFSDGFVAGCRWAVGRLEDE